MKKAIVAISLLFTTACATSRSANEFAKKDSTHKVEFEVPMNYQKAYRIISDQSRKCLQQSTLGNQNITDEMLDPNKEFGEVTLTNHNTILGDNVYGYYVVRPASQPNHTIVNVYEPTGMNQYAGVERKIRAWLAGETACWKSSMDKKDKPQ